MAQDKEVQRRCFQAWYSKNKERHLRLQKVWRDSPRGAAHRFARTLRKYGITQADWDAMWAAQDAKCVGCLNDLVLGQDTHIDHCHTEGYVRGLLCSSCNLAIGKVKDSAPTLRRLASYLEKTSPACREVA